MNKFTHLKIGELGLVQQTKDGKIIQIGMSPEQSKQLQAFCGIISQEQPLVQMGEDYELTFKK